jgi:hypothetical protein
VILLLFLVVLIWCCRRPKSNLERNKKNIRYGMLSPVPFMSIPINGGSTWRPTTEKGSRIANTVQPPEPSVANMASSNLLAQPSGSHPLEIQEHPGPSSPHRNSIPLTSPSTPTEAFANVPSGVSRSLRIRRLSDCGFPLPSYFLLLRFSYSPSRYGDDY